MSNSALTTTGALALLIDVPAPGAANMVRDLALLDACARGEIRGAVRLYGFQPACLSLGRMQPMSDVDLEACARDGVDVVRRPSGGRGVLHDQEVTYSVVCRSSDPLFGGRVLESCSRIHNAVAAGLALLGVPTRPRALPADIRRDAREGAAVPDCFARPAAHELLDPPRAAPYLHTGDVAPPAGAGIRELLGRNVTRDELVEALAAGFRPSLDR